MDRAAAGRHRPESQVAALDSSAGCSGQGGGDTMCSARVWERIARGSPREGIGELRLLLEAGASGCISAGLPVSVPPGPSLRPRLHMPFREGVRGPLYALLYRRPRLLLFLPASLSLPLSLPPSLITLTLLIV